MSIERREVALRNMQVLRETDYTGRGFVLGQSSNPDMDVIVYWLTGRSTSSRNRRITFNELDGSARTEAYDPSLLERPELLIYSAIREVQAYESNCQIVSNGDQTDTVAEGLVERSRGVMRGFERSLETRTYEPDKPNFTTRITGLLVPSKGKGRPYIKTSKIWRPNTGEDWLKDEDRRPPKRDLYYPEGEAGFGSMIHTYEHDGNPLPVFKGESRVVLLGETMEEIAQTYWDLLSQPNRVAMVVKAIHRSNSQVDWASFAQYNGRVSKHFCTISQL
jgi:hypothetical protein